MNILDSLCACDGICAAGVCAYETLIPYMTDSQRVGLARRMDAPQSVLVALFPYLAPETPGNLSIYARGQDYHAVVSRTLEPLARAFADKYPPHRFEVLVDDSPLPEVQAAACAGLGCVGAHGLLIHPVYGSYVFIGTILTDLCVPAPAAPPASCLSCGACARICPVGLDKHRCLSALTQKGGALTEEEAALVRAHPLIWGCDLCQQVCPMNQNVPYSDTPAFRHGLIDTLSAAELDGLTRRQFLSHFPARAFTWKGPAPLRRNLALHDTADSESSDQSPRPKETK